MGQSRGQTPFSARMGGLEAFRVDFVPIIARDHPKTIILRERSTPFPVTLREALLKTVILREGRSRP